MAPEQCKHSSSVLSLNGDPKPLQKIAEWTGINRMGLEVMSKLLEKGVGFGSKHTWSLNANWDKVVSDQQVFSCSACSATKPGSLEANAMWEGTSVSGHVASHTRIRPQLQGMIDAPSGCVPSEQRIPVVSRWDGIPAADRCLWTRMLMLACLGWRPWLLRQLKPWVSRLSTSTPL